MSIELITKIAVTLVTVLVVYKGTIYAGKLVFILFDQTRAAFKREWRPSLSCRFRGCRLEATTYAFSMYLGKAFILCPLERCTHCGLGVAPTPMGIKQFTPKDLEDCISREEGVKAGKVVRLETRQK